MLGPVWDERNSREWNKFSICPHRAGQQSPAGQQGFMREEVQGEPGPAWQGLSLHWLEEALAAARRAPQAVGTILLGHYMVY